MAAGPRPLRTGSVPLADRLPSPARVHHRHRARRSTLRLAALGAALVCTASATASATPGTLGAATASQTPRSSGPGGPPTTATTAVPAQPDPLTVGLDGVVQLSAPDTCLAVAIDGQVVYRHAADHPMVPASTLKLFTATAALARLGDDHRFRTVVTGGVPASGVVAGDLTLVGGGDPLLVTNAYRQARHLPADQPLTSLDHLADLVKAAGVTRVTGRIVGDERRYDTLRSVPTWPDRYLREQQIGPMSALSVDDGFVLQAPADPGGPVRRLPSADPALDAARTFTALLRARGITVQGEPAVGTAPAGGPELTAVESAPLSAIVTDMLHHSDNGTAELLTKELGHTTGQPGTTAVGTLVTAGRLAELGVPLKGVEFTDGSGLDPGNHVTCDALVAVLDRSGGIDSPVGAGLPVAGESGTLQRRFVGTAAAGRLRAKTGSLNQVTSLAGFVALDGGGTATFAYVSNGPKTAEVYRGQDLLGDLLGQYVRPCAAAVDAAVVAPVGAYLLAPAVLAAAPLGAALVPAVAVPLAAFERYGSDLVQPCVASSPGFELVLG